MRKAYIEKNQWWITIVLTSFLAVLAFFGTWTFSKIAESPMTYETKKHSESINAAQDKRQADLEKKIDDGFNRLSDQISEINIYLRNTHKGE